MKKFFKKNLTLFVIVLIFLLLSTIISQAVIMASKTYNGITIVLDAGHGGRDGGSVGVNGTIEKQINLAYTLALKERLVKAGYRVELTRKNDDGLYSNLAKNKKVSDMNARLEIIKKTNPNLVISIHMNSFPNKSASGANTYYRVGDEASQTVANLIQASLNTYCNVPNKLGKAGDYFILNSSYYTAVLIECGFISNPEEESLLNSEEYKNKMIDAICSALMLYFGKAI